MRTNAADALTAVWEVVEGGRWKERRLLQMPVSRGTVMVTWTRAGADGEKCTGDYLFEIADGLNVQGKRDASKEIPSLWRLVPCRGRRANWGPAQRAVGMPGFKSCCATDEPCDLGQASSLSVSSPH